MNYTLRELMVAAAAREIRDGDKVFVGMATLNKPASPHSAPVPATITADLSSWWMTTSIHPI